MKLGYFLATEEFGPAELLDQARMAEEAGFQALWISDHFHPWIDEQGHSPMVWSVIGALSQVTSLPVTTAVTCPTMRTHPAIVAQGAATSAVMLRGGFVLGLGSGEALNEHIIAEHWPETDVRLEMLEEAVEVIRKLFGGDQVSHYGKHYKLENARLYDLPDTPPPIYISGFGPKAIKLAGRIADGYIATAPKRDWLEMFRDAGGEGKPTQGGVKVCWGPDEAQARQTVRRLWPTFGMPGELSQVLPTPAHFQQTSEIVSEQQIGETIVCGDDVGRHVDAIEAYINAGFDEVYVGQIGPDQRGFFEAYGERVLPALGATAGARP